MARCKQPAPGCGSCVQDVSMLSSFSIGFCMLDVCVLRPSTRTASVFLKQLLALAGEFTLRKLNFSQMEIPTPSDYKGRVFP